MIRQFHLNITKPRGFHLITADIARQIGSLPKSGLINIFCRHTSAGLTINENCDSSVRVDFETVFNRLVPEDESLYTHTAEGEDDMPAHIKSTLVGPELTIPIINGELGLGTWQGIYFCEFRNISKPRTLIVTIYE
ncbi:MAG: secondary thiamine-phosphate synthase [Halobacteriovoraceae bacterium]|nr:secondary thiamine-phosphate synthase [Halobacteriovoraceae bacterium]|tara:strand:+ start:14374 stop:14781 length:408 start_codon:yes stop_codon:yes gene_type:complete